MTTLSVGGWMFLLVLAHPGCPGEIQRAVKRLCVCVCVCVCFLANIFSKDYRNPFMYVKVKACNISVVFLRHGWCTFTYWEQWPLPVRPRCLDHRTRKVRRCACLRQPALQDHSQLISAHIRQKIPDSVADRTWPQYRRHMSKLSDSFVLARSSCWCSEGWRFHLAGRGCSAATLLLRQTSLKPHRHAMSNN